MSPVTFTKDNSFIISYRALWSLQLGPQKTSCIISEEGAGAGDGRETKKTLKQPGKNMPVVSKVAWATKALWGVEGLKVQKGRSCEGTEVLQCCDLGNTDWSGSEPIHSMFPISV